jgi:hypothetical protein
MGSPFAGVSLTIICSRLIGFRAFFAFDLRFSGGVPWQQLQPHDLFAAGQVVNQVDQSSRHHRRRWIPEVSCWVEDVHGVRGCLV